MGDQEVLIDIRERLVRVETKLDTQNGLREKVDCIETKATETEARSKSNTHRIDKLEANNTWLWRTVVGAIICAGVAALAIFK
ncbi:hemolysin XhlA [Desulfosporosinus fructosivorans]|uniref:Hemolysin XhlA n=1 Tax=Desulfosporosinus fructosivorans TaxID=2018669 RepID=A0A4Z0R3M7_9FIRM|nr:hemolysin XhlA family protein [Desulfosporosinus fructosivorans]TGE37632.1 hemolysin XhlA [Desulfosporosinus fructosivorans]